MTPTCRLFRSAAALALALIALADTSLCAQDQAPPAGRGGGREQVRPAELAAMLDAYTVMQAQNALQLSDEQFGPFVTRLKRLQENRRRNNQIRNRFLQDLRTMSAPAASADENALREKLRALREHNQQSAAALQRDSEAVDEVLNVRQQVRFRLLEERLERQKLDLLMRSRRRATPPGTPPTAGGRGPQQPGLQ
jgi:hypothetical protein